MTGEHAHRTARKFFEDLWRGGDYWDLEGSPFERARFEALLSTIDDRRYRRVLEVGCGAGDFTRLLSPLSDYVLGIDVSDTAVARGTERAAAGVELVRANVMEFDAAEKGPWDLIILSETIYYLGWLYSFFDVAWLAHDLLNATTDAGRLLLANTRAELDDPLVRPWIIDTYRDLFVRVGYRLESERVHTGTKSGVELDVLISLFQK